jgi:hypothetical protein
VQGLKAKSESPREPEVHFSPQVAPFFLFFLAVTKQKNPQKIQAKKRTDRQKNSCFTKRLL